MNITAKQSVQAILKQLVGGYLALRVLLTSNEVWFTTGKKPLTLVNPCRALGYLEAGRYRLTPQVTTLYLASNRASWIFEFAGADEASSPFPACRRPNYGNIGLSGFVTAVKGRTLKLESFLSTSLLQDCPSSLLKVQATLGPVRSIRRDQQGHTYLVTDGAEYLVLATGKSVDAAKAAFEASEEASLEGIPAGWLERLRAQAKHIDPNQTPANWGPIFELRDAFACDRAYLEQSKQTWLTEQSVAKA